ncbi:MAG: glutamate 5-kinase [Coriobacteriia bacterium]
MSSRTIVIKLGSSTVTGPDGRVDVAYLSSLAGQVARVRESGDRVVVVTSGAIAAGVDALGLASRPSDMPGLQAAASVGQVRLIGAYKQAFSEAGIPTGQVLLTRHELGHRPSYVNACQTLERLLGMGVVPVVNENDTTAVDEIRMGDNDQLAALVGIMVQADLVALLTDTEGLYSSDPRTDEDASLVARVETLTDDVVAAAGGSGSDVGSGGMATKLEAARVAMKAGIPLVVCDGHRPDVVVDAAAGEPVGTYFCEGAESIAGRKLWIAYGSPVKGTVEIDDGARDALCSRGKSLLPAGVVATSGSFAAGDAVDLVDARGKVVARGLSAISREDLDRVKGMKTSEISKMIPDWDGGEVVHRDCLVIL